MLIIASLPQFVAPARSLSNTIVISQIYGGGGNSGATFRNDFIELFNRGSTTVNITGWSVQYASPSGTFSQITALTGTIAAGQYFLVQEAAGTGGTTNLPSPDAIGNIPMSASSGKVALVNNSITLSGTCPITPTNPSIVDFVGYGTSVNCSETNPTANLSNTTAAIRQTYGCAETDNNSADFVIGAPTPRNSASPRNPCSGAVTSTPTSTATPTRTGTTFPARAVVINEVAWGGTAANSNHEWIELYNTTTAPITLTNWTLRDEGDINVTLTGTIPANGFFLLERTSDTTIRDILADQIYAGGLTNSGETLTLRDLNGNVIDTANGVGGWPAGSASPLYFSMERRNPLSADTTANWASNDGVRRNGSDANSNPINGTPKQTNSATLLLTRTPTPTCTSTSTATRTQTATRTPTRTATATLTPTRAPAAEPLLITEVLYDGTQAGEGDEFIELSNPLPYTVNLTGYKIGDEETRGGGEGMYEFPPGTTIAPNQIILIVRDETAFRARFPAVTNRVFAITALTKYTPWASGSLSLSNSGDEILLLGPSDQIVDSVAWGNGDFAAAGLRGDASASAPRSLQRYGAHDTNHMSLDFLRGTPSPGTLVLSPTPSAPIPGAAMPNGMFAYWGDMHSHSTASDGDGPPRMAFDSARANGLHFYALTDHDAWLDAEEWNAIGDAARAATVNNAFIALRGFEWTHSTDGHINIYNSATYISRDDPNYDTLPKFYAWLAAQPNIIAQFNHPDPSYGGDFDRFAYNAAAADKIALLEIGNNGNVPYQRFEAQYSQALIQRWRVAPGIGSDHHGLVWGNDSPHRTGVIAPSLTTTNVLDALRAHRVFATEDANLALALQSNGAWMGGTITAQVVLTFTITARDPNPEPITLELYDNGVRAAAQVFASSNVTWTVAVPGSSLHAYYVRAIQSDGDLAFTAPIWTDNTALPTPIPPTPLSRESTWDLGHVSIETARTTQMHKRATLEGCVTVPPTLLSDRYFYLQDESGGIRIYLPSARGEFFPLQLHDRVRLRGIVASAFGERELELEGVDVIEPRGSCGAVAPRQSATGAIDRTIEGWLVQVRGRIVWMDANELQIDDGTGIARLQTDPTTQIRLTALRRGQQVRVVGVVTRWRSNSVITPRYDSDIEALAPPPTPTRMFPSVRATATRTRTAMRALSPLTTATVKPSATNRSGVMLPRATEQPIPVTGITSFAPDAVAVAVVGGSTSVATGFACFVFALALLRRKKT